MRFLLQTRQDTLQWGTAFGALLRTGDVVALIGDLGSGKTTLTQAIAAGMGLDDSVTSPTYNLIQEYAGPTPMFHFDTYRLENPAEMSELGLYDYLELPGVVVVEWADRIHELLPNDRFEIEIVLFDPIDSRDAASIDSQRLLSLKGLGARSKAVVERFGSLGEFAAMNANG